MKYPDIPYQHNHQLKGEVRKAMRPVIDGLVEKVASYEQASVERYSLALDLIEQLAKSIQPTETVDLTGVEQKLEQLLAKDTSVTVKAPDVAVRAPSVDLTGIEKAIASQRFDIPTEFRLDDYQLFKYDEGGTVNFYTYEKYTGEWYILREDTTNKEYLYALGKYNILEAYDNRKKLKYANLSEAYGAVYG